MKLAAAIIAATFILPAGSKEEAGPAMDQASACSDRALERYARTADEAGIVAAAAFDACGREWGDAAKIMAKATDSDPAVITTKKRHDFLLGETYTDPLRSFTIAIEAMRRQYIARSVQKVLTLRAGQ